MSKTPELTVRSMAEFMRASAARRKGILHGQKHPKEGAQQFMVPYYGPARTGIADFYRRGNSRTALSAARSKIESLGNATKRANNHRVLDAFEKNDGLYNRKLTVVANTRYDATLGSVRLKLSPDLQAMDGASARYIYYHFKAEKLSGMVAEAMLAVAHWVLVQNQIRVPANAIEFIDLFTGAAYTARHKPIGAPKALLEAVKVAEEIWTDV